MNVSQRTVGLLIDYLAVSTSQGTLGGVLKTFNLGGADPGVDTRAFSTMSKAKRADIALSAAFKAGQEKDLIALAAQALRGSSEDASAPVWVKSLLGSLRADGFECVPIVTVIPANGWPATATDEVAWSIGTAGYSELPIVSVASGLETQLNAGGFTTAAGHYSQALKAFLSGDWATSNGQLRTTFESVLLDLAARRTGSTAAGGGAAIDALQKNGDLPFGPNEYVRGLWKLSHPNGAHPGLSDEDDARHRIHAVTAIVDWLIRNYG